MKKLRFEFIDKALWFPVEKIIAIADLHIGYEDALNKSGVMVPRQQFEMILEDLKKIFSITGRANTVVICGDLKHEFGSILEQEWRETLAVLDYLQENTGKIVLVKGNHDKILEPIVKRRGIEIVDFYANDNTLFMHGDQDFLFGKKQNSSELKSIKMIVVGHKHPALVVSDRYKSERYKCFLQGKWNKKLAIVLPSFFPLVEGSEIGIDEGKFIIPASKLTSFEAYAVGDKVYRMGKVRDIGRLN